MRLGHEGDDTPELVQPTKRRRRTVKVELPASGRLEFPVHAAFGQGATQAEVAEFMVAPAVDKVLNGINAAILVYGQTGSGKTYSMEGNLSAALRKPTGMVSEADANAVPSGVKTATASHERGIIPRTFERIFNKVEAAHRMVTGSVFNIRASYMQIYKERICT